MAGVDGKYYEAVREGGLAERVLLAARDRIYEQFVASMKPTATTTIVDVGVSDVINAGANVLERRHPFPDRITACGIGSADAFQREFPQVRFVGIEANRPLPFADRTFDIATCNAVMEHVGSRDNQRQLMRELTRVASRVFVTVPNRYFPVEHHTALPLVHFNRWLFERACALTGRDSWAEERNLILMDRAWLAELGPAGAEVGYAGIALGAFSSNLYLSYEAPGSRGQGTA